MSVRPTLGFKLGASSCFDEETSYCARGLRERAAAASLSLSGAEMAAIDGMTAPDQVPALFSKTCNPDLGSGNSQDPLKVR